MLLLLLLRLLLLSLCSRRNRLLLLLSSSGACGKWTVQPSALGPLAKAGSRAVKRQKVATSSATATLLLLLLLLHLGLKHCDRVVRTTRAIEGACPRGRVAPTRRGLLLSVISVGSIVAVIGSCSSTGLGKHIDDVDRSLTLCLPSLLPLLLLLLALNRGLLLLAGDGQSRCCPSRGPAIRVEIAQTRVLPARGAVRAVLWRTWEDRDCASCRTELQRPTNATTADASQWIIAVMLLLLMVEVVRVRVVVRVLLSLPCDLQGAAEASPHRVRTASKVVIAASSAREGAATSVVAIERESTTR